jgi:periplasmic mercuric ion binding protein
MKTLRIFPFIAFFIAISTISFAQTKTETFKVSGNCGMCKKKIETAAKDAGASSATWNTETKELTVKYKSTSTNTAKIQRGVAAVGYDNVGFKAPDAVYNKLHGCCKYDRAGNDGKKEACCAEGEDCKDHATAKPDCCKDGKCTKEGHNGADCCKQSH